MSKDRGIEPFIAALRATHAEHPDLRVGQIIVNALHAQYGNDPFYVENEELVRGMYERLAAQAGPSGEGCPMTADDRACDECGSPGRCRPDCSFVRGVSKDEPPGTCVDCHGDLPAGWPEDLCGACEYYREQNRIEEDNRRWDAENGR